MESYYIRHREELLERQKIYNNREENKVRIKAYQKKYYADHKPPPPSPEVVTLINDVNSRTTDLRGLSRHTRRGRKGARPPKSVWLTSKLDSEEQVYGMTTYRFSNIVKNCPLGFYQRPEGENPFQVSFS